MRIDVFAHILTPKYMAAVDKYTKKGNLAKDLVAHTPSAADITARFRITDKYDKYLQILTNCQFDRVLDEPKITELAKISNDEMAELVARYPDKFATAIASLPLTDVDASLKEIDRSIKELKFRGIELWTSINGKPLDLPEFYPIYEKMCQYDLPILIHPCRSAEVADYSTETKSKYAIFRYFGWVYETTVAMSRLVFGGVLQKYPTLKIVTHHCGAMVPFLSQRISSLYNYDEMRRRESYTGILNNPPVEYFRMFYNDTAIQGNTSALMCANDFFGADHLLFGTDMPMDSQDGNANIRDTIDAIEQMAIPEVDKKKIFETNARKLFKLPF